MTAHRDLRRLPAVHVVADRLRAEHPDAADVPAVLVTDAARAAIAEHRHTLAQGAPAGDADPIDAILVRARAHLARSARPALAPVVNATGIVLHTGLGRAPHAPAAARAAADVAAGYAPVELDLDSGGRGRRADLVRGLLCRLTGAETATVVNNNAAALMLALAAIARDRSVIVARGELIEIGGSFRLPEIMRAGGAILREVGTTNRTRLSDYAEAIDATTAAILKVHPSNYHVAGFTEAVPVAELAALGRHHDVAVIDDIGSGALRPTADYGWASDEPNASASIAAGADLVLFSGDKLLGGPQAGILAGRRRWIDAIERHPMMRAMRVDKVTLAALGATLHLHLDPARAAREIPVLAMLTAPVDALRVRAATLAAALEPLHGIDAAIAATTAHAGGGALPAQAVPSAGVVLRSAVLDVAGLAARLRHGVPAVVARVHDDALWLDLRTVLPGQDDALAEAVRTAHAALVQDGGTT